MKPPPPGRIICSGCASGGYHLPGRAPSACAAFPHGTEIYLCRRGSTDEGRVTTSLFLWREQPRARLPAGSAAACCLAPALSAPCPQTCSLSCPFCARDIFYRHLRGETQLMRSARAEDAALWSDSVISHFRMEDPGRTAASCQNLMDRWCKFL